MKNSGHTSPELEAVSTYLPGHHDGNMDLPCVTNGCRLYFPVKVPGALLHLGDAHVNLNLWREEYGNNRWDAWELCSFLGKITIGNIWCVAAGFPKKYLRQIQS